MAIKETENDILRYNRQGQEMWYDRANEGIGTVLGPKIVVKKNLTFIQKNW